jgi:guanylate kinase
VIPAAPELVGVEEAEPAKSSNLTVVSGPTAVGKGTVVAGLARAHPEVFVSVSVTTRPPRPGEQHGVHYLFISDAEFDALIASEALLEWAVVHGVHRYGTPRQPVFDAIAGGRQAVLEIDLQGARQVKGSCPEARFVFLAPPSWEELVRRLVGRGTESADQRERRLATARVELASAAEFEHVVVNGEVGQAVHDLVLLLGL